ncbi:MAG: leucyl aminopeptidase [Candidatus Omnitrophica bacterium]|nr:leucyl aminopeptidase [Candidatus Omnitrophota bacterium]
MKFSVVTGKVAARREPLLLGVTEGKALPPWAASWPADLKRAVLDLLRTRKFQGKLSETFLLPVGRRWVVLVGAGKREELTLEKVRQAAGTASRRMLAAGFDTFARGLVQVPGATAEQAAQAVTEGTILGTYRYTELKALPPEERKRLRSVVLVAPAARDAAAAKRGVQRGQAIAEAVCWTRDLVNRPSNRLTPTAMAREATAAARRFGFRCKVLGPSDQRRLGMNALLGVARGSREPSQFMVLEYRGPGPGRDRGRGAGAKRPALSSSKRPLAFLGKGITFDSGGISIKPSDKMEQMKYDMAGGAAVLGAMRAVAALKLPVHVVGLVPATENLPGGSAQKPGDVVRALGGKTIEVINTDAEGRLVLADALGYAKRYKPAAMVDLATLTGACVVALGQHCMGLMTNSAKWAGQVKQAAQRTSERAWELPLWPEYTEAVKSDVADVKNVGDGKAGTITAAAFLKEFAGDTPWVHLDIAGVAWADAGKGYQPKGATGVGVRLLTELASQWKGKV